MSKDIRYISRAINKEKTVKLKNGSLVYFAMNPLWFKDSKARQSQRTNETSRRNTKSIVLVDVSVDTNSGILFDTVKDLLYHLGYTALGGTGVVKRYMGNDKLNKKKDKTATLMLNKKHLTQAPKGEGLEIIKTIKSRMNTLRSKNK